MDENLREGAKHPDYHTVVGWIVQLDGHYFIKHTPYCKICMQQLYKFEGDDRYYHRLAYDNEHRSEYGC